MADQLGSFTAGGTIYFMFSTHEASGAPVAPSSAFEAADLVIYKNGSATQRASASGVTMTSPFDSVTGLHAVAIDLSDNTDAGFYAAGSEYVVVLSPDETVDSAAVLKVLAYFAIERVPKVNVTQYGGSAGTFASGRPEVNTTHFAGAAVTLNSNNYPHVSVRYWRDDSVQTSFALETIATVGAVSTSIGTGAITAASFAAGAINAAAIATDAITDAKVASDVTIASVTGAVGSVTGNVGGSVASVASGGITSASFATGAITATAIATDAIGSNELADSAITEIQNGLATAAALSSAAGDITSILADTGELQTDWANGGRLDVILDARASQTSVDTLSTYVDTEVAAIKSKTDNLPASPAAVGSAMVLSSTGLNAVLVDGVALPIALQRIGAVTAGKLPSGAGTSTEAFVGLDGVTTRVTFTVDVDGNRTGATYNDA